MARHFYTDGQLAKRKMMRRLQDEERRDRVAMQHRIAAGDYSFLDGFPCGQS